MKITTTAQLQHIADTGGSVMIVPAMREIKAADIIKHSPEIVGNWVMCGFLERII